MTSEQLVLLGLVAYFFVGLLSVVFWWVIQEPYSEEEGAVIFFANLFAWPVYWSCMIVAKFARWVRDRC